MKKEELEKLYNERRLIKQLLSIDYPRYTYLEARSQEIKTIINSNAAPIENSEYVFALYDAKLADKITKAARETLNDVISNISDPELIRDIALYSIENTNTAQLSAKLLSSINPMFAFTGLYPNTQKTYNIKPE